MPARLATPQHQAISRDHVRMTGDYCVCVDGMQVLIRRGFESDGATIPRICWRIGHPFEPLVFPGAVTHDALYSAELVDRALADAAFAALLRVNGVHPAKVWTYLRAVGNLGWWVWRKHTPKSVAAARKLVSVTFGIERATCPLIDVMGQVCARRLLEE